MKLRMSFSEKLLSKPFEIIESTIRYIQLLETRKFKWPDWSPGVCVANESAFSSCTIRASLFLPFYKVAATAMHYTGEQDILLIERSLAFSWATVCLDQWFC